jgi:PIN domain nuclease of toxin-antitoxin system
MDVGMARAGSRPDGCDVRGELTALLDTHFLIWLVLGSRRLAQFPWLKRYCPWGVSPVSLLEIQFLYEVGRLEVQNPGFTDALLDDTRFIVDEVPLLALVRHAIGFSWTRDPFDRLLAAHSAARRTPFCTTDRAIQAHYSLLVPEVRH